MTPGRAGQNGETGCSRKTKGSAGKPGVSQGLLPSSLDMGTHTTDLCWNSHSLDVSVRWHQTPCLKAVQLLCVTQDQIGEKPVLGDIFSLVILRERQKTSWAFPKKPIYRALISRSLLDCRELMAWGSPWSGVWLSKGYLWHLPAGH